MTKTTNKWIKMIYEAMGRVVFADHPDWVWLMKNREKLERLLNAGKN